MINNFTTEQLLKLIHKALESLDYEVSLSNPTTESKFPVILINTPLESTIDRHNKEVLHKRDRKSVV